MKLTLTTLIAINLLAAASAAKEPVLSDHLVEKTEKVMYTCTVSSSWSSENHPVDYPSDAHTSPPVLVAHNANYKMFTPGSTVGEGVQVVAETGDPTKLGEELIAAGTDVMNYLVGVPMFFEPQPAETRRLRFLAEGDDKKKGGDPITARTQTIPGDLIFTPEHNLFTSICMLAPSPDWFSASHGNSVISTNADGDKVWQKSFHYETLPYDAGTDSGTTFTSEDAPTDPKEGSAVFTTETSDIGIFVNPAGDAVLPVMTWECSIANVQYKCEFDENCKADDSAAACGTFLIGSFLSSMMIGAALFM